jgi:hypothetical protein
MYLHIVFLEFFETIFFVFFKRAHWSSGAKTTFWMVEPLYV